MIKESKVFKFKDGKQIKVTTTYQEKYTIEKFLEDNFIKIYKNIQSEQS